LIKEIKKYYHLLFFVTVIYSNEFNSNIILDEAITDLYNYEFVNSKIKLDLIKKKDPLNPVVPFLKIVVQWLYNQTQYGYEESYEAIINGVNNTIPQYEKLIEKYPENAQYYLYLGSSYGLKARVALANKEWFHVLSSGYKGYKYIRKTNKLDNTIYDYYLPIGLLEYFLCISSKPVQMGGKLMGFESDCEVGKSKLELALEKSDYSWIEASNILTYIYLYFERDYENALRTISPLVDKFPGHPFFTLLKAEVLAKLDDWEELDLFRDRLEFFTKNGTFLQKNECELKLKYIDSIYAFKRKDYDSVFVNTDWIINNYHMEFDWLLGLTYMIRGQTFDKLNMQNLAIKEYHSVVKLNNYFPEIDEAKELIKLLGKR